MSISTHIEKKLRTAFEPEHLDLRNESHQHSVPANSETHFNLIIVSAAFEGQSLVQRQRQIYQMLSAEMAGPVHALTMKTLTPKEWAAKNVKNTSPPCLGGSKATG
jgi:BolA protein